MTLPCPPSCLRKEAEVATLLDIFPNIQLGDHGFRAVNVTVSGKKSSSRGDAVVTWAG